MKLGDCVTLIRGTTYKSSLLSESDGPVLLGLGSIERHGGFKKGAWKHYPGSSSPDIILHPGDLYVSLKDLTQACDLLGAVARVPKYLTEGRLTQDTVKLHFQNNASEQVRQYVYWSLRSPQYRAYCKARGTGTTNMSLSRKDFLDWEIPTKTKGRDTLVQLLELIELKLALNSRLNDHLLEMALSEYKELSRQSSSKRTLQDCTSLLCRGGTPKYCEKGKFRALNQRCIRNHKIDDANARRIENPKSSEKLLRYGDILICSTGTGTLGRSAQVLCHDERVTVDSHVTIMRPAYEALVEYLGCWALSSEDQFESMAKGSTGQTELPRTELAELEIGFPDTASLNDFSGKTKPLFEAIQSNVRENQSLECLRDALLSKLMSGEIDVSRIGLRQLNGHLFES